MQITLTKVNFQNIQRLQEANYLLTNGLGGYSSLTLASSATRNDHCLFMACLKAPNHRYQLVKKIDDCIHIGNNISLYLITLRISLTLQACAKHPRD